MKSLTQFIFESKQFKPINYPFDVDFDNVNDQDTKKIENWLKDNELMPIGKPSWVKPTVKNIKWGCYIWSNEGHKYYTFGYTWERTKKINGKSTKISGFTTLLQFYNDIIYRHNKDVAIENDDLYFKDKLNIINPIIDAIGDLKFINSEIGYIVK